MKLCKICGRETNVTFNIEMRRISVCQSCANSIAWQQVESLIRENNCRISYDELTKGLPTEEELATQRKIVREASEKLKEQFRNGGA